MLSRLALRAVQEIKPCTSVIVRPTSSLPQSSGEKPSEVAFERRTRPVHPGKVRMCFVPEEWFQMFYPKTGVTGPYVFGLSVIGFLLSKEYFVLEHEVWSGASLALVLYGIYKMTGSNVAAFLDKEVEDHDRKLDSLRDGNIVLLKEAIANEKQSQVEAQGQAMLFEAKRENVGLQLETAYRQRLVDVHRQVKRRLDYQLETANIKARFEQKHMVNWIVDNVRKSITPAQEAATLKQCLGDLKALSAKA